MQKPRKLYQALPGFKGNWDKYYAFDIREFGKLLHEEQPEYFEKQGSVMALDLFRDMSRRVPAYKDFLKKNKVRAGSVKDYKDLEHIPLTDKKNYLSQYSLQDLCWDGKLDPPIISASSGTSGSPTFWPRSWNIELETTYLYELFLNNLFGIRSQRTLLVSGFAMGIYVGGTFTLNCAMRLSKKNYPLTIVTPGIHTEEILHALRRLEPEFDQIILGAYPPLARDVIELALRENMNIRKGRMKLFFASESISEDFRSHLYDSLSVPPREYETASMNLYGTADAAIAGHETPDSILLRRAVGSDESLSEEIFGDPITPSVNQFYPFFKHFEVVEEELAFSSFNNGVPLCRYNIHDRGGIIRKKEMDDMLASLGHPASRREKTRWSPNLPFVYLYGRSDNTVKLFGALIYPETIKQALESKDIWKFATGKFTLSVRQNGSRKQVLEIHTELKPGISPRNEIRDRIQKSVTRHLLEGNLEYANNFSRSRKDNTPRIVLWAHRHPRYFSPRTKQKWVG